ncbi:PRD domain-containing protein [Bacillus sp. FSL K6-4563]|uniref:BglG family transcription antiterminator LicT n=1 Tax=Bacillus safensis TaxID=561879 RepID=A0AC61YSP3_BACIA|nr:MULTISPECIES: PRD domain-containing protein [Bacillus]MBW4853839.1 PRD domain-containing protein [Bacillaceae bacterium]KMK69194.1 antitermination protein BlgG [Bacillus safensis]KML11583.1 antitermination protein BlgG [Bacillus safensis]KML53524.1 antitermination protein BlgG [Bacillus safensis]KMN79004.1 antitermination protein BlgG [Bacillus safensis]
MEIIKVLNTSVVLAKRDDGKEIIVMGKAIGFKNKPGSLIQESDIQKIYVLEDQSTSNDLAELMRETPEEFLIMTDEIISYAKRRLSTHLNEHLYISLTDHLFMATKRFKENLTIQNRLLWEVKKFYPEEFSIGLHALELIEKQLGIQLPEEEAANIAFHLVNAQQTKDNLNQIVMMTNMVKDILNIIKMHYKIDIPTDTINYSRFLTHLQFFVQRLLENKMLETDDHDLIDQIMRKYPEEVKCVEKIEKYIKTNVDYTISSDEKMYLIIHVNRVVQRNNA